MVKLITKSVFNQFKDTYTLTQNMSRTTVQRVDQYIFSFLLGAENILSKKIVFYTRTR